MSNKPVKSVLITDLDNTLFDWFDIWCATFIPMLDKVVDITGIPKDILIKEIRPVHRKHGTAEYAFLLEELPCLKAKYGSREAIMKALNPAIHLARSNRIKHMKLFYGVYDTLAELRCRRVRVIAYTESKEWYTKYRLQRLGLDFFIERVYSPKDHQEIPISDGSRTKLYFQNTKFLHTPINEFKPNPKLLLDIVAEIGADKEDCVYIGDSEIKDIDMASDAGITSVFAKYGVGHFEERPNDYNLLRDVTHWTDEEVAREKELKERGIRHKADFSIDNFSELLEIIDFQRPQK
jgi:phosphoglycolate phosphatase-like HAD superfamily hydrolase